MKSSVIPTATQFQLHKERRSRQILRVQFRNLSQLLDSRRNPLWATLRGDFGILEVERKFGT